ncbi:MAG TPA: hypothetical protein DCL44_08730, partial [Elusimicrobia bacterium]|nr:hypothetical protein [Elusimicrobiota bacterium]
LDYPGGGFKINRSDTATISNDGGKVSIDNAEKLVSLAKKAIIRLLLTPEEVQLAAYAVATDTKFSLVIRDSNDTGTKVLQPVDIKTFTKEKKQS